jgi:hypothetical protein
MGCQRCIFFTAPTKIMVPWYTVEPPTNGICPKHCRCAHHNLDNDIRPCLDGYYERRVLAITEQTERNEVSKEILLEYAASPYWEGKAEELQIPFNLMDLTASLPPCVAKIVERQIDGMLEDFDDLEEWFFAFEKAPAHEKQAILDGYEDRSYSETLKRRRDDRATFLALNESYAAAAADPMPLFGPPSKKLKQTTLTQDFNEFPGMVGAGAEENKEVIDLTHKPQSSIDDRKPKAIIDLTYIPRQPSTQTPGSNQGCASPPKACNTKPILEPPSALDFSFKTPPRKRQYMTM